MGSRNTHTVKVNCEGQPSRLLIVEDMRLLADVVRLTLEAEGHEVVVSSATTAESVLEEALAHSAAVALVDASASLGVMDVVNDLTGAGIAVLMLMRAEDEVIVANCIDAGAVGFVSKNGPCQELNRRVAAAFAGERVLTLAEKYRLEDARRASKTRAAQVERFETLTTREKHVLLALTQGYTAAMIAEDHFVALSTVRTQIRSILAKLDVNSQLAAVALAAQTGWIQQAESEVDEFREAGATMVEYALMVGLIALVVAVAVGVFGIGVGGLFDNAGACVGDVTAC